MVSQPLVAPLILSRYRGAIEQELRKSAAEFQLPFYRILHYHLGFEDQDGRSSTGYAGKALRPALLLFAHEALGGQPEEAIPAAVALELVHSFSLMVPAAAGCLALCHRHFDEIARELDGI
jgi:geranylgeranyl diphosphate synthase type I